MKEWRDLNSSNFDDFEVTQLVAPKPIRSQLLIIARYIPASGQLRIANQKVYWKNISIGQQLQKMYANMSRHVTFVSDY